MKKFIFFIVLITSSIFIISCSNKQNDQPVSNNISSQVNTNEQTQPLTPTPITNNSKNIDATVQSEEPFYGLWIIKNVVAFCKVSTYDEDEIKKILGKNLRFSKEQSCCFGDDISYLNNTVKNPTYKKSTITSDEFSADFEISLRSIGINTNAVTLIEINDTNNFSACKFYIKDDNSLILYGGGTFFDLNRESQDVNAVNISTPTPSTASNNSILDNAENIDDNVSDDSNNEIVDNYLCNEHEDVLFSFKIANSNKSASICISKNQQDYIIYRFGTRDKIELVYPIKAENSWSLFTYSYYLRGGGTDNEGLDLNYLSFKNGGYTYEIYEEYSAESDKPIIGIKVTKQETSEETNILGDSDSTKGSLISLRDNSKIKITSK